MKSVWIWPLLLAVLTCAGLIGALSSEKGGWTSLYVAAVASPLVAIVGVSLRFLLARKR